MSNFYDQLKNAKRRRPQVKQGQEEEFRAAVAGVKPLAQDKINLSGEQRLKRKAQKGQNHTTVAQSVRQQHASFSFSDMFEARLPDEGPVRYRRSDVPAHTLKQLRRGDFSPELMLDLHGLTRESTKQELTALISAARQQMIDCVSVMHGHGQGILRQALPHYLIQHPHVRAFHQAPLEYGGQAALLVLIESDLPHGKR